MEKVFSITQYIEHCGLVQKTLYKKFGYLDWWVYDCEGHTQAECYEIFGVSPDGKYFIGHDIYKHELLKKEGK